MVKSNVRSQLRSMTEELKHRIGLKVQAARKGARMTQEELASLIHRAPESVSNIERGIHLLAIETVLDLANALSMAPADFLEGANDRRKVSRERLKQEARLNEISRALSDQDLALAVAQTEAILKLRS